MGESIDVRKWVSACPLVLLCLLYGGSGSWAAGEAEQVWEWRVGPVFRVGNSIEVQWDGDAVAARMPDWVNGGTGGGGSPPVGATDRYADRSYADGYVRLDPGTTDPETDVYGMTWYWGYENASQRQGDTVVFHSTPVEEHSGGYLLEPWRGRDESDAVGVGAELSRTLLHRGRTTMMLVAGCSWYDTQHTRFEVRRRGSVSAWRYVDTYSAPHTPFPSAPYSGTYEGPGYLISNQPDSRTVEQTGGRESDWEAVSSLHTDTDMLDVHIGLGMRAAFGRIGVGLSPHIRAAWVGMDAHPTTTVAPLPEGAVTFGSTTSEQAFILGAGMAAETDVRFWRNWRMHVAVSADWWADAVNVRAEPFDVELELGHWSATAGLGSAW